MTTQPTASDLPAAPLCRESDRYTYHLVTSRACMPPSCRGDYRRVAILRVDRHEHVTDWAPLTIREQRGVEIVQTWEKCNVGKTERCAYKRALAAAAAKLYALTQQDTI